MSKKPFETGSQIATFSVHGTNNLPNEMRDVTTIIHNTTVGKIGAGKDIYDTRFTWVAPLENNDEHRETAARRLTHHVVQNIVDAVKDKRLDPDKALVVNLVGFSHGGNVALRAADDIAAGLKQHPVTARMNLGVHLTTLSTPAYKTGAETPAAAFDGIRATDWLKPVDGSKPSAPVLFSHTSITVKEDQVIPLANGATHLYPSALTSNISLPAFTKNPLAVTDNHGALQNIHEYKFAAAREVGQTFVDRTRRQELEAPLVEKTKDLQSAINTSLFTLVDSTASKNITDTSLISKTNDAINKNEIYKTDGALLQVDKQQLQAVTATTSSPTLVEGNDAINKLLKQAMSGVENTNIPNKLDAAALAVQTISQSPAFKQNEDISVIQGTKGLIVSQGQGPAGVNLLVPPAEPGDFNKVSEQMTRSQPQQNMQLAQALPDPELTQKAARSM